MKKYIVPSIIAIASVIASREDGHSNSKGTGRGKFCFALFLCAFLRFMSILVVNTHNESCNEDVQIKNLEVLHYVNRN